VAVDVIYTPLGYYAGSVFDQYLESSNMYEKVRKFGHLISLACVCLIMISNGTARADDLSELPAGDYSLDLSHASVVWKLSHLGFSTYVARFTDFEVELNLDTQNFTKSTVSVDIDVNSIETAYPWVEKEDFDKVLATDWFKVEDHPTIKFVSREVSALDGNKATIKGDLTLLGETNTVMLDVTLNGAVASHPFKKIPALGFSATTTIDRTVWGLSKYAPAIVGAEVRIEIEAEFTKNDS
jgi:polyisoprenoid-binding protein YceI